MWLFVKVKKIKINTTKPFVDIRKLLFKKFENNIYTLNLEQEIL